MIKIRLQGTRDDLAEALPVIRDAFNVLQESTPYQDRGQSAYWRLYIEAEIKPLIDRCATCGSTRVSYDRDLLAFWCFDCNKHVDIKRGVSE
jgi:hypothetical protein